MPVPTRFTGLFAMERIDDWVLRASIAIPIICIAGLILWHLVVYLAARLTKPKTSRPALEPRPLIPAPHPEPPDAHARTMQAAERVLAQCKDDPEQLQRVCAAWEDSLAALYLELAESWLRKGQREQALATLQKIVKSFPNARHALAAQDRLRQIGSDIPDSPTTSTSAT